MSFGDGDTLNSATGGLFAGNPSVQTYSLLSKQQKQVQKRLGEYFNPRIGKGMEAYDGNRVAQLSPYESQGLGWLSQYLGGQGQYMPQRQAAYGQALAGNAAPAITPEQSQRWFDQYVQPYYQASLDKNMANAAENMYAMGGGKSSSAMNRTLAQTAADQAQQMNLMRYNTLMADQDAARQREIYNANARLAAMASEDPSRTGMLQMVQASQQFGALPRLLQQAQLDADFQEFLRTRPELSPVIQQALQFLGIQTTGQYMQPNPGFINELTGGMNQITSGINAAGNLYQAFANFNKNSMPGAGGQQGQQQQSQGQQQSGTGSNFYSMLYPYSVG